MKTKLYYIMLGALLGSLAVLAMSMLNILLISYIGCSFMSLSSSSIGISLASVMICILMPLVLILSLKQV
jgi:hypothetical protein